MTTPAYYPCPGSLADLFHVKYSDWSAIFGPAVKGGALKKIKVHGKPALALPEYVGDPIKELKALITPDAQAKPTKATMPLTASGPAAQPKPPELIAGMAELAEAAERISHVLAATFEEINRIVREANTRIKTTTLKGAQS